MYVSSMDISLDISMVTFFLVLLPRTWYLVPCTWYCVVAGEPINGLVPADTLPLDRVLHGRELHGQPIWQVCRTSRRQKEPEAWAAAHRDRQQGWSTRDSKFHTHWRTQSSKFHAHNNYHGMYHIKHNPNCPV